MQSQAKIATVMDRLSAEIRTTPREVWEELEIVPLGVVGSIHAYCLWSPHDEARIAHTLGEISRLLPNVSGCSFIQILGDDRTQQFTTALNQLYSTESSPRTETPSCDFCGLNNDPQRLFTSPSAVICNACVDALDRDRPDPEKGHCVLCGNLGEVRRSKTRVNAAVCAGCLRLIREVR